MPKFAMMIYLRESKIFKWHVPQLIESDIH